MKKSVIIILSSLLFINLFFLFPNQYASANETVKVKVDILNVRSGPSLDYQIIAKVYQNQEYPLLDEKNDWVKIRVEDKEGWIAGWFVEKINVPAAKTSTKSLESNVTNLNVRKGPSQSFSVIDQIQPKIKYPVLEIEGDWVKIQLNSNKEGWVAKWLVNISDVAPSKETFEKDFVTVKADILNVRTGPSTTFNKIGTVEMNQKLEIMDINEGWYKIKYDDNSGWIAGEYASKVTTDNPNNDTTTSNQNDKQDDKELNNQVMVNVDILNLRNGPSLDNEVIGKLKQDDVLVVHDSSDKWLKVSLKDSPNTIGWVADWFVVKYDSVVSNLPTVTILNPGTNLREGPSTSHQVVGIGNVGDQFAIIGTEGDWYHIQLPDGGDAYVAGWIVSTKGIDQEITHGIEKILKDKVIVVDAGHGGRDYGTTGKHFNSLEKILNYKVAALLEKKLEAAGAKVVLSRPTDQKISLQGRVDISANYHADAFVSIHHNSNYNPYVDGTITYYYDSRDRKLASYIQSALIQNTKQDNLGISYGNYYVLRENSRVAVLVELAFLSNYQDELKARSTTYQEKEAEGIFQGLIKYFEAN